MQEKTAAEDVGNSHKNQKHTQSFRNAQVKAVTDLNLKMVDRYRQWLTAQQYAPSTTERYCRVARELCHYIGERKLSSVEPMDIGDYLTQALPARWTDNFISDRLGALRSFFDFLYLGGVVDKVAPRFLKSRARMKPLPRSLTQAQIGKLIKTTKEPRDRALLELLYSTGCRIGEVRTLRVEDIDFKERKFKVRGKRKERIVLFGKHAAKALIAYLNGRRIGYVFESKFMLQKGYINRCRNAWIGVWMDYSSGKMPGVKRSKTLGNNKQVSFEQARRRFTKFLKGKSLIPPKRNGPMNRSSLAVRIRELGRLARIANVNPHAIRHSFATHLLERGADIRAIQELLGHTYLTSTQVYTKISNNAVRATFRRFHPRG
jgi:integrase/recombinase XerC